MDYLIENYLKYKELLEINENNILECYKERDEDIEFNVFYEKFSDILNKKINDLDMIEVRNNFNHYDNNILKINETIENYKKNICKLLKEKEKILKEKVNFIGKLKQPEQRSKQWYDMRKNMLTASDIGAILGYSKYTNKNAIIKKKCGEGPKFRGNKFTLHGQKYEEIAKQIYEMRYNKVVDEYGLIQHPNIDILGASPDGISRDGIMLEIKCPPKRKITGEVPKHYWVQMQVQLQVCSLEQCDFIECLIEEYDYEEDYEEDVFDKDDFEYYDILPKTFDINHIKVPDDRKTVYGLEKGVIGEIKVLNEENKYESQYFYPPFNLNTENQIKWLKEKEKEINEEIELVYWKLSFSSLVNVMRDDKWWKEEQVVKKLNETWEEILDRRETNENEVIVDFTNLNLDIKENNKFLDDLPKCEISSDEEDILGGCLLSDSDN